MRSVVLMTFIAAAAAAAFVLWTLPGEHGAQASTVTTIGIDVDPTGNSATSLGPIDQCIQVSAGSSFQVDVFIDDILPVNETPNVEDIAGYNYSLTYPAGWTVTAKDHLSYLLNAAAGSSASDGVSDGPGDNDGQYKAVVSDFGTAESCGSYCEGVLGHYTLQVPAGTAAGAYSLGLGTIKVKNSELPGKDQFDPARDWGIEVDNDADGAFDEDLILDGETGYGLVAVDMPCSAVTPFPTGTATPGPSPEPSATPSPAGSPAPGATPTPTPGELMRGWNYVCHLGPEKPIEAGLAGIAEEVLAVYRLRGSEGYDIWFPGQSDISTITTLHPYEALFLLVANTVSWPQDPSGPLPTSVQLTQGWNSVCYTGQTKDGEAALASIGGKLAVAYALGPAQAWQRFVPAMPDISDLGELRQYTAVLLLVSDPAGGEWLFDP